MATNYLTLSIVTAAILMALISSSPKSSTTATDNIPSRNQDLSVAIDEMQRANYFTFVMLINMAPPDLIQGLGNITFLMPKDRTLSNTAIIPNQNAVSDFLRRQSIPAPLRFDQLNSIPTGSMIPTSKPGFMLQISNSGRHSFFLNNVRVISPNICTGSSIICHGIDGVLQGAPPVSSSSPPPPPPDQQHNFTVPPPPPPQANDTSIPPPSMTPPAPAPLEPPPPDGLNLPPPLAAPPSADPNITPQKSGSSHQLHRGKILKSVAMGMVLLAAAKF